MFNQRVTYSTLWRPLTCNIILKHNILLLQIQNVLTKNRCVRIFILYHNVGCIRSPVVDSAESVGELYFLERSLQSGTWLTFQCWSWQHKVHLLLYATASLPCTTDISCSGMHEDGLRKVETMTKFGTS